MLHRGHQPRDQRGVLVDFENVSAAGLESSPVADALAGLRANEARYLMNTYTHAFTVLPASESRDTLDRAGHRRYQARRARSPG